MADAYGLEPADRGRLPTAIRQRLLRNEAFWYDVLDDPHAPRERRERAPEVLEWTHREFRYIEVNQAAFISALSQ